MRKFQLGILWIISTMVLSIYSSHAQTTFNPSGARMYQDIAILAADSLQGRATGSVGCTQAAHYIADQMLRIGLKPAGDDGSFLQAFTLNYPVHFVEAKLTIGTITFKYPDDFGATDLSSSGTVAGILTEPFPSSTHNRDILEPDFSKYIVAFDLACIPAADWEDVSVQQIRTALLSYENQGYAGILVHNSKSTKTEEVLFGSPFTDSLHIPVIYIARKPWERIQKLKQPQCTLSAKIERKSMRPANVVGMVDNHSKKTILIGAHYDHLGLETKADAQGVHPPYNGADDNASGVAMILELARWINNNESLHYNYLFVAFSGEEIGLLGSKAFVSQAGFDPSSITYMLNLDMVGRLGCQGDTIRVRGVGSSETWPRLLDKIEIPDLHVLKIDGAPPFSDHAPFLKRGIPVIYVSTGLHPQYHTADDDLKYINVPGMEMVLAYLRQFLRGAEQEPAIPFKKLSALKQTRATLGFLRK